MPAIALSDLPAEWIARETHAQQRDDQWFDAMTGALLIVPSVVVPLANASDRNVLVNHRHPAARETAMGRRRRSHSIHSWIGWEIFKRLYFRHEPWTAEKLVSVVGGAMEAERKQGLCPPIHV